jgi:hypothetical protein
MVGNWLYGVARLTALKLRESLARRRVHERPVTANDEPELRQRKHGTDVCAIIELELSRLPDLYRTPVILCDLEGKTRKEAAVQLGWPEGSVSSRLSRARAMLARRLARHGLAESAGSLAFILGPHASLPATLTASTFTAIRVFATANATSTGLVSAKVAALTKQILDSLFMAKLAKASLVCWLAAMIVAGAAWSARIIGRVGASGALEAQTQSSDQAGKQVVTKPPEELPCTVDITARGARVLARGAMVKAKKVTVEGNRCICYTEGTTMALFVDGDGTEPVKMETQDVEGTRTSTGQQKMYIASGPIQINKTDSETSAVGVIRLESGRYHVSATGTAKSEVVNQVEFTASNNRLFLTGTLRGMPFDADVDQARWDYQTNRLILTSKTDRLARLWRQRPDKEREELRGNKIFLILQSDPPSFHIEGGTKP